MERDDAAWRDEGRVGAVIGSDSGEAVIAVDEQKIEPIAAEPCLHAPEHVRRARIPFEAREALRRAGERRIGRHLHGREIEIDRQDLRVGCGDPGQEKEVAAALRSDLEQAPGPSPRHDLEQLGHLAADLIGLEAAVIEREVDDVVDGGERAGALLQNPRPARQQIGSDPLGHPRRCRVSHERSQAHDLPRTRRSARRSAPRVYSR